MSETATTLGTATARMTRVLFVGTALTGIAFSALTFSRTLDQVQDVNFVWIACIATGLWGIPIVIVLLASWAPIPVLRGVAVTYIAIFSFAVVTWPFAMTVGRIPDGAQPWIINLLPMAMFAAALVLPQIAAWGFLLLMCLAVAVLRYIADGGGNISIPVQDSLFNFMYIAIFVAIIFVTLRAGRRRDETAEQLAADAIATAAAEAQDLQRATAAALTHDEVISTLVAAARSTDASAALVPAYATRALQRLDALSAAEDDSNEPVPAHVLVASLRETVSALAENVAFSAAIPTEVMVPNSVVRALTDATAEAVRNSVRHADTTHPVARTVTVVVSDALATVDIVDDGAGFDTSGVSAERFGIRFSIMHRMMQLAGGSASIESRPGAGTRVALLWIAEPS